MTEKKIWKEGEKIVMMEVNMAEVEARLGTHIVWWGKVSGRRESGDNKGVPG